MSVRKMILLHCITYDLLETMESIVCLEIRGFRQSGGLRSTVP